METQTLIDSKTEQIKKEVLADIISGIVPTTVNSFSELHDYVDANCYGSFCEDEYFEFLIQNFGGRDENEGMPQGMLDFMNQVQDNIDSWLKTR